MARELHQERRFLTRKKKRAYDERNASLLRHLQKQSWIKHFANL